MVSERPQLGLISGYLVSCKAQGPPVQSAGHLQDPLRRKPRASLCPPWALRRSSVGTLQDSGMGSTCRSARSRGKENPWDWERGAPPAPTRRAAIPWLPGATSSPEQLGAGRRQGAGSLPPSQHTFCPAEGQRTQFYPHFSLFFPHIRTKTALTTTARSQPATSKQEGNK